MSEYMVYSDGWLDGDGRRFPCALGHGGVSSTKREGDGVTPAGTVALRQLFYRPDRVALPGTAIDAVAIDPDAGWCDAPGDPAYNQPVRLPYSASVERLWRWDGLYDLCIVLGYNDDPVVAGKGSAIFLHIARPCFSPTEGCVALARADFHILLPRLAPGDTLRIETATAPPMKNGR